MKNPIALMYVTGLLGLVALLIAAAGLYILFQHMRSGKSLRDRHLPLSEEQMLHSLFEYNPQPIVLLNLEGNFMRTNSAASLLGGYSIEELKGKHFGEVIIDDERKKATIYFQQTIKGIPQSFETAILNKEGFKFDLNVTFIPVKSTVNGDVTAVIAVVLDITNNKRAIEKIKFMAYYDDMTGIPNRIYFRDQLENALHLAARNKSAVAVLCMDIDRFKLFNDSFGHNVGNMLLLQVAERLSRCVSSHDVLARMEGDEFAIFYTDVGDADEVAGLVRQIFSELEQPFECQGYHLLITMSVGISLSTCCASDADELMKLADIALSRSKELGRNNFQFYSASMERGTLDRLTMESDLRAAMHREEFELYYQPQVNIVTGECTGVEGLIRWNHPEKGVIMPGCFIPIAEETGMIVSIGEWVIRAACAQAVEWKKAGLPQFPVSVNLSVRQFLQPNLAARIAEILLETGMDPHHLELEITESVTSDFDIAEKVLNELKTIGVNICIDDFGTGYSSLSYLRRFPISRLKIDRSFVRDVMTDQNDAQIVQTIIAMSRHLKMKVIAEGVENQDQLLFLQRYQCWEAQGYLFGKPMKAEQLSDWLRSRKEESVYGS